MKNILIVFVLMILVGCSTSKPMTESTLVISRKYVGNFIDYRVTEGEGLLDFDIFWIKTTLEEEYGKIAVYGKKKMEFEVNDRLYVRRTYYQHSAMNHWVYHLESSDQKTFYVIYGINTAGDRSSAIEKLFGNNR